MRSLSFVVLLFSVSAFSMESKVDQFCGDLAIVLQRLDIASSNVANANTTRTPEGGPYKRKMLGVCHRRVCEIVEDTTPPKMIYNPDHVDANSRGYVAMPNVNPIEEMADMIMATRVYEVVIGSAPVGNDFFLTPEADECISKYPRLKGFDYRSYLMR